METMTPKFKLLQEVDVTLSGIISGEEVSVTRKRIITQISVRYFCDQFRGFVPEFLYYVVKDPISSLEKGQWIEEADLIKTNDTV
jgi:hypothetical protein